METAIGAASWLVGKVLNKLSDDTVAAFVASSELGLNAEEINTKLKYMHGLLHFARERDVSNNPGLQSLLEDLTKKADEAEDTLDELHYFMIQDQLDGTREATPELGDGLRGHALHGVHVASHTIGNSLPCSSCSRPGIFTLPFGKKSCLSCSHAQDNDFPAGVAFTNNAHNASKSGSGNDEEKLKFDRVAMSKKIKSVIESIHNLCNHVSDLLNKIPNNGTVFTFKRAPTGSTVTQDTLYGRRVIFEQTVNALTNGTYLGETLSVLPLIGPGGIGKTTFAQHLYNDERIEKQFTVKVWVCVSTDFDVLSLTRQIHSCIPRTEKENTIKNETTNLDQLQKSIAQRLKFERFLIVLDDMWKCNSEADWRNLLSPFIKGKSRGNMVLVTTRFPFIAQMVKTTDPIELRGLESNDFFALFEACIFVHSKPDGHYWNDLIDVAKDIARKLKGSPLAAYTVGRLLRKNLSREYWIGVLEKSEWKNAKNDDDIMPSLKISYDYLPFYLKKCFSYCSLFPEDYRFRNLEITSFLTAIGIINTSFQNYKNYLEDLVENGFLMRGDDKFDQYYVMHDLLHELSRNVSKQECVNINNSCFRVDDIPQSIRHLSITAENIYNENFVEEMDKLRTMIDIGNLHSLMIFGMHDVREANILKDTFEGIKGLRILFIAMKSQESLPNRFSNLIHLRYLKISSPIGSELILPSTLSRLYHLKFLDLQNWRGSAKMPKDFSHLVNLRHFCSSKELHSNISEVGKMRCLEELKEFCVKKDNVGFELKELGELRDLGGELCICNLEAVTSKEEANDAKLKNKRNLKVLRLVWGEEHQTVDDDVLDGLHPPNNLRVLCVINSGVNSCPRWLGADISTTRLESLHIEGVCWVTLPSFGQLPHLAKLILRNVAGVRLFGPDFGGVTERSFMQLKTIVFEDMPDFVEWVGGPNTHQFSRLQCLKCRNCPLLYSFPFLEFSNLCTLDIVDCPELSRFAPMPYTSTLTYVSVIEYGMEKLFYDKRKLHIEWYNGAFAFHNMASVYLMEIKGESHITLADLRKLNSLRRIHFKRCDNMFSVELDDSFVFPSVQNLRLDNLCITGELFSKVMRCFPFVSQLTITQCNSLEFLRLEDGGLQDLRMLQSFSGRCCGKLFSEWPMGEVGGGAHAIKPFPSSLTQLDISVEPSLQSMGLLSNLTFLTSLSLIHCRELTMDGFNPLMTVNLQKLFVDAMYPEQENISIAGNLLSEIARRNSMDAGSFKLEEFLGDSISAVLTRPMCSHLATTLHTLQFLFDQQFTAFTEEQEKAVQLLTSLQHLKFDHCMNLESLPGGLQCLSSLNRLDISCCEKILSLPPKEGLPTSLKDLGVYYCNPELTEHAKKLKGADPWFLVEVQDVPFNAEQLYA